MTEKRKQFINEILEVLNRLSDLTEEPVDSLLSAEAAEFFEDIKSGKEVVGSLTESGATILKWVQENYLKYNNILSSKIIGEALFLNSRSVSGSMRKLVSDGYISKSGNNPVMYSLTDKGKEFNC